MKLRIIAPVFVPLLAALAQDAPSDLTIMAPAAPGGGWDQTARVMQHVLRETGLARSVQVVNAAGAAGTIGLARFVNTERGNPRALLVTGLVMLSGVAANRSPVTLAEVTPIARLSGEYEVIVVPAASPFLSLDDLIAAFRESPRAISWGGGSAGGTDELLVRLLAERLGVDQAGVNYIAYSGGGQALAAVLGAHVSAAVSGLGEFRSQIEAGQLRALAISAPTALEEVSVPTFHDRGVDLTLLNWRGVVAAPGITRAERRSLDRLVGELARSAEWRELLHRSGWEDIYLASAPFERFLSEETARIAPLVARAGGGKSTDAFTIIILLGLAGSIVAVMLQRAPRRGVPSEGAHPRNVPAIAILSLALVADVALIEVLGFVIASAVMFGLTAHAFGSRRPVRDAVVGLALSLLIFVVFTRGLGVMLPTGFIG